MTGCTTSARRQSLGLDYRFVGCLLRILGVLLVDASSRPKSNRQRRFVAVGKGGGLGERFPRLPDYDFYGRISIKVPASTSCQTISMFLLLNAIHPLVQLKY